MLDTLHEAIFAATRTVDDPAESPEHAMILKPVLVDLLAVEFLACLAFEAVQGMHFLDLFQEDSLLVPQSHLLRQRMISDGWCPSTINILSSRASTDVGAYAFALGSSRTKQNHVNCIVTHCEANQTDGKFGPSHVQSHCACDLVGPPMDEVVQVLKESRIPVLEVELANEGQLERPIFTVKLMDVTTRYIAISHVWSDGLGNSQSNLIPKCQLDLLVRPMKHPTDPNDRCANFWLDTLCIPVDDAFQELRAFSISKMQEIYRDCFAVLVLDPDISHITATSTFEFAEISTRLAVSAWITRLWTYQEGALPTRRFIRIKDGMLDLDKAVQDWANFLKKFALVGSEIGLKAWVACKSLLLRKRFDEDETFERRVQSVFLSMAFRSTSRMGDEAICIATSIGLDPRGLLELSPSSRMYELLNILPTVPMNILFSPSKKLARKGYRWAPESYMQGRTGVAPPIKETVQRLTGEIYKRPPTLLCRDVGVIAHLTPILITQLDLENNQWHITLEDSNSLRVEPSNSMEIISNSGSLCGRAKHTAILMPYPLDMVDLPQFETALLVLKGYERHCSISELPEVEFLCGGLTLGKVKIEINPSPSNALHVDMEEVKGKAGNPQWWLLDGMPSVEEVEKLAERGDSLEYPCLGGMEPVHLQVMPIGREWVEGEGLGEIGGQGSDLPMDYDNK